MKVLEYMNNFGQGKKTLPEMVKGNYNSGIAINASFVTSREVHLNSLCSNVLYLPVMLGVWSRLLGTSILIVGPERKIQPLNIYCVTEAVMPEVRSRVIHCKKWYLTSSH